MAFCNKLGGLLRQGAVTQTGKVPVTSMLGSLRLMSTKLFIGGKDLVFLLMRLRVFDFKLALICTEICKFGCF